MPSLRLLRHLEQASAVWRALVASPGPNLPAWHSVAARGGGSGTRNARVRSFCYTTPAPEPPPSPLDPAAAAQGGAHGRNPTALVAVRISQLCGGGVALRALSLPGGPVVFGLGGAGVGPKASEQAAGPKSSRVWTVPNAICLARIACTPYIALLIVSSRFDAALVGLAIAGLSDALDGYIARTFDQRSVLGSYLDPLSDKILINTLAVACALPPASLLPPWVVSLILLRDSLLIAGAFTVASARARERGETLFKGTLFSDQPLVIKASPLSKANTALQLALLAAALGAEAAALAPLGLGAAVGPMAHLVGATTALSFLEYGVRPGYQRRKGGGGGEGGASP